MDVIDVESWDRAVQLAGELSLPPGRAASPSTNGSRCVPSWPHLHGHRVTGLLDELLLRERLPR